MDVIITSEIAKIAFGVIAGGVVGYFYYRFIGCSSGACPITSNKFSAILYGAAMGLLLTLDK